MQRQGWRMDWLKGHQKSSPSHLFFRYTGSWVSISTQIFAECGWFYSSFYLFVSSFCWELESLQLTESRGSVSC